MDYDRGKESNSGAFLFCLTLYLIIEISLPGGQQGGKLSFFPPSSSSLFHFYFPELLNVFPCNPFQSDQFPVRNFLVKGVLQSELAAPRPGAGSDIASPRVRRLRSVWTFLGKPLELRFAKGEPGKRRSRVSPHCSAGFWRGFLPHFCSQKTA